MPNKRKAPPRSSGAGFTHQQKIILLLASLLVTAWVVFAIGFILTKTPSFAQTMPNPQLPPTSPPTNPIIASTVIAPVSAIPISAACAQRNSSVEEGTVTRVEDSGLLRISTANGTTTIGLAGIVLLPYGQPGELALQAIRTMAENQPVLLVRDSSAQDDSGPPYRYVFTQQGFVNEELVHQGLAVMGQNSQSQSCAAAFHLAEQKARSARLGMWKPTPIPTRTFMPFVTLDAASQPPCDCSKRYECTDFTTHTDAQACYNACNDYNSRLDPDRDGIACENLP